MTLSTVLLPSAPLRQPGFIQSTGVLLGLLEPNFKILQVSDNTQSWLGLPPEQLLGKNLTKLFSRRQVNQLTEQIQNLHTGDLRPLVLTHKERRFETHLHRSEGLILLELIPNTENIDITLQGTYNLIKQLTAQLQESMDPSQLCQVSVEYLRQVTGFDRVMVYRFDQDWNGEVIAEARNNTLESFLGLHFPAEDIPDAARQLFKLNETRAIGDVQAPPAQILPTCNPLTGHPLDLSLARLRGVAPVHIEYLQNMGVGASKVLALVHEGTLWGLVAFHHHSPRTIPFSLQIACRLVGRLLAVELVVREQGRDFAYQMQLKRLHTHFYELLLNAHDLDEGLLTYSERLLSEMDATGLIRYYNGEVLCLGQSPDPTLLDTLIPWLQEKLRQENLDLVYTDRLPHLLASALPHKHQASGLLAIPLSLDPPHYLLWFRPEILQTITWGGNPEQTVEVDELGKLHPRKSFECWKQSVFLRSKPWQDYEIEAAMGIRNTMLSLSQRSQYIALEHAQLQLADLQKLNRLKDDFMSTVSHELRTPVSNMKLSIHMLKNAKTSDKRERYLQVLESECHREIDLINDLLDLQSLEAGTKPIRSEHLELYTWLPHLLEGFHSRFEAQGQDFSLMLSPEVHSLVTDPHNLERVLVELVNNACKYTAPQGQIRLAVEQSSELVSFNLANTITATIPAVELSRIFDKFYRIPNHDPWRRGGTGLGLYLVKKLVERMGGNIQVHSQDGWINFRVDLSSAAPAVLKAC